MAQHGFWSVRAQVLCNHSVRSDLEPKPLHPLEFFLCVSFIAPLSCIRIYFHVTAATTANWLQLSDYSLYLISPRGSACLVLHGTLKTFHHLDA